MLLFSYNQLFIISYSNKISRKIQYLKKGNISIFVKKRAWFHFNALYKKIIFYFNWMLNASVNVLGKSDMCP